MIVAIMILVMFFVTAPVVVIVMAAAFNIAAGEEHAGAEDGQEQVEVAGRGFHGNAATDLGLASSVMG